MDNFIDEDMRLAIKKGAIWMDENHPGWEYIVDPDTLAMDECESCIIGQVCMETGYWDTIAKAEGSGYISDSVNWARENGFDAPEHIYQEREEDSFFGYFADMERVWTEEVKSRLGGN